MIKTHRARRLIGFALVAVLAATASPHVRAADELDPAASLDSRFKRFLEEVAPLLDEHEREVFLGLRQDYQRDHFIRRFWKAHDPFPQTGRNELREVWEERASLARDRFETLESDQAQMLLVFGEPTRMERLTCGEMSRTLEVWSYEQGSGRVTGYFTLVFLRPGDRMWRPRTGLRQFLVGTRAPIAGSEAEIGRWLIEQCVRGEDILAALVQAIDVEASLPQILPQPSEEWVSAFQARSTDVDPEAELLPGEIRIGYPGRHQSRTVVQGTVAIPRVAVDLMETGDYRSFNLLVDGEILRQKELFDHFRYRFDFPADAHSDELPLVLQRYLRPGAYQLILKVEDMASGRVLRIEHDLQVPRVARARSVLTADIAAVALEGAASETATSEASTALPLAGAPPASAFETRLLEANSTISTGDHSIQLVPPPPELLVGKLRVLAQVRGDGIDRVAFELNDRAVMKKSKPPYSIEIDLGDKPRTHTLRAIALGANGERLAVDEVLLNAGPHRFALRLVEPQSGKRYTESVRVHAEVEVPEGERLDRVEIFLNETRLTTLYQPPFEQPILLSGAPELAYVRAIAYLADGTSAEEAVFINAPDFVDEMKVSFVELFTSVLDKKGEAVEDLSRDEITVLEDDVEQQIRRFERVGDLPIRTTLVLDASTSMIEEMRDVQKAALRFFESVVGEHDRAALVTFSDAPELAVRFTSDPEILAGGLAGLVADGETALWDTVIFTLHYMSGLRGQRAIIFLTDGEDSSSEYSYDDALEFARQTGIAIYFIGLDLPSDQEGRMQLRHLAEETGGGFHPITHVNQLGKIYEQIQKELRSQYLIAYQSTSNKDSKSFRRIEVRIERKGVEAKTLKGYFP